MKKDEYQITQTLLLSHAKLIASSHLDLDEFIEAINRAESVGPVLDPTLYIKGKDNLEQIKIIAKAARRFKKEIQPALEKLQGVQS